jgi:hypothetical protein
MTRLNAFFTAPITDPTLLFVLTPEEIYKIIMLSDRNVSDATGNAPPVTLTQVLKLKNLISMEINFANQSVCVLEDYEIFCYKISNFIDKWKLPNPDFLPLDCEFAPSFTMILILTHCLYPPP